MRSDVHFAALRAAAKLALGMAVLGGCSAAEAERVLGNADDGAGDEAESSESAIAAKDGDGEEKTEAKTDSTVSTSKNKNCTKDAGPPKPSCEQVLASAFPDGGDFWSEEPGNVSQDVKDCCIAEIKDKGWQAPHHWACCMATNWGQDANDQQVAIACTPWGPPVPPKMRQKRVDPKPDAWAMHMGVA